MARTTHTYQFARLSLTGVWDDKRHYIHQALVAGATETRRGHKYGFSDVRELVKENGYFASGRLVKYKPILKGEVFDEETHEVLEEGLQRGVVAKSEFFLHYDSSIVAYRPVAGRISAQQFRTMFGELLEAGHQRFFISASLSPIDEEYSMEEAIARFERIHYIAFELHPTNPSNRDVYARIDERLKALHAAKMKQEIVSTSEGLDQNQLKDDDAVRGLIMASDGYGRGVIEGEIAGRRVTITTEDSPVQQEVAAQDDPADVLQQLLAFFNRIWRRGKDDGQRRD